MARRWKKPRATEHNEQASLFDWIDRVGSKEWPELALAYAIPNSVPVMRETMYNVRAWMKKGGLRPGFPDVGLPVARGTYHGLFLELKTKTGSVKPEQRVWMHNLERQGYYVAVARGWETAAGILRGYMRLDRTPKA